MFMLMSWHALSDAIGSYQKGRLPSIEKSVNVANGDAIEHNAMQQEPPDRPC
jgi:hypothetical protein